MYIYIQKKSWNQLNNPGLVTGPNAFPTLFGGACEYDKRRRVGNKKIQSLGTRRPNLRLMSRWKNQKVKLQLSTQCWVRGRQRTAREHRLLSEPSGLFYTANPFSFLFHPFIFIYLFIYSINVINKRKVSSRVVNVISVTLT